MPIHMIGAATAPATDAMNTYESRDSAQGQRDVAQAASISKPMANAHAGALRRTKPRRAAKGIMAGGGRRPGNTTGGISGSFLLMPGLPAHDSTVPHRGGAARR